MANKNSPEFVKLKRCNTLGVKDRISALPNELLLDILSLLTLKEAIATGVLSRRWKYLWSSCPNLDFGSCADVFFRMDKDSYVQIVNKVLGQYTGSKLHQFRSLYPLCKDSSSHIDDWISFALTNGVSVFELSKSLLRGDLQNYSVPAHVFMTGKMMQPMRCCSVFRTSLTLEKHFTSLREFHLKSVNLSDEVFEIILSRCPSLETLFVMYSYGLVNAKNKAPHSKLKTLELNVCYDLEKLELLTPNLVSFNYKGWRRAICFKDSQKLVKLMLLSYTDADPKSSVSLPAKDFVFQQFASYVPILESLTVMVHIFEDKGAFTGLPVFGNLKQLVLDAFFPSWIRLGYYAAAAIMRVAPNLQQLELNLPGIYSYQEENLNLSSMSPHQNLKELKFSGFRGDWDSMEFATFVIEHAVSLQKISITVHTGVRMETDFKLFRSSKWSLRDAVICETTVHGMRQTLQPNTQLLYDDDGVLVL